MAMIAVGGSVSRPCDAMTNQTLAGDGSGDAPTLDNVAEIRLFDGVAPFFIGVTGGETNWSKSPFARIEHLDRIPADRIDAIVQAWERYCGEMAAIGYNAVTVDDVAHLVSHPWYPPRLRRLLADWQSLYTRLFAIARRQGLCVFATSDYCFFNDAIDAHLDATATSPLEFFAETVALALRQYGLDGVVLRLGESDGVDVSGAFTSRLTVRRPADARRVVARLLPLFERAGGTLVVRTWTLGAFPIGDLIWNPATWDAIFAGLQSEALVVSLKYGEADFFRYLDVNPLFFHGAQRKLIEFQARREYEGMGEFPSFTGWMHARHRDALRAGGARMAGFSVVQAGGWSPWSQLAFVGSGSLWSELNLYTILRIWLGASPDDAIRTFYAQRMQANGDPETFLRLLRHADRAIEQGLYIREFAQCPLYFRRVRLPPLLWASWRDVTATGLVALLHRHIVTDAARAVAEGWAAVDEVEAMCALAPELGVPLTPLAFQRDTFRILALARAVLLGVDTPRTWRQLEELLPAYQIRYPHGYRFALGPDPLAGADRLSRLALRVVLRRRHRYRMRDRLMLTPLVSHAKIWLSRRLASSLPVFVNKHGMSAEMLLR
jgi:hypothetical protein